MHFLKKTIYVTHILLLSVTLTKFFHQKFFVQTEAENLYLSVGRYDLLNKLYQDANKWDNALKLAQEKDRINMKNTYNAYGKYLESKEEIQEAIKMYEMANTHRKHVPRLLLQNHSALEKYLQKSQDPLVCYYLVTKKEVLSIAFIYTFSRSMLQDIVKMVGSVRRKYSQHGVGYEILRRSRRLFVDCSDFMLFREYGAGCRNC